MVRDGPIVGLLGSILVLLLAPGEVAGAGVANRVASPGAPGGWEVPGADCFAAAAQRRAGRARAPGSRRGEDHGEASRTARIEDLATRYRLAAFLEYDRARLTVRETIGICNRSDATLASVHLSVLAHAFGEQRIVDVRVGGRPVRFTFPRPGDLLVRLPGGLGPTETTSIVVRFVDRPSDDTTSSLHASLSRAYGMMRVSDWFPIVSDGHGLRPPGDSQATAAAVRITLDLTLDRPLTVAAPGVQVRRARLRQVFTIRGARDYAFAVSPRFERASAVTRDGVVVHAFVPRRADAGRFARLAAGALEAYADAYGPYPWSTLVVAPNPRRLGGHEYPGIAFVGSSWLTGPTRVQRRYLSKLPEETWHGRRYVLTHEVAHQWFYALVGNHQLREPWVDEAMSEFTAYHFFGPPIPSACGSRPVSSSVWAFPRLAGRAALLGWDMTCDSYVATVYRRGALMVDGVRRIMGDEAFFEAVRRYVVAHRFGLATGDDLVAAWLEGTTGDRALRAWLAGFLGQDIPGVGSHVTPECVARPVPAAAGGRFVSALAC